MSEDRRPTFFLRAFQVVAYAGAIPFAINTVDVILHPLALPLDGTVASRLIAGLLIAPVTLVIGILCARRAPDNLIGWMVITFAYGTAVQTLRRGWLPVAPSVMISSLVIVFFWFSYILIPLYFPNGRLYPPRANRWGNPLLAVLFSVLYVGILPFFRTITWGTGENVLSAPNPFFVVEINYSVVTIPLIITLLILGLITLILRYRNGTILERLQLRWLMAGGVAQFGVLFLSMGLAPILNISEELLSSFYAVIIPTAIGIAILRYRLYDIDIIIRRTMTYSVITALLAGVYFGAVTLLQSLFSGLIGSQSPLAVVISTLAIAAMFTPLRRRVQNFVDRRFNRSKYNAEKTLEAFAESMRDDVDMDHLSAALVNVVEETMQPESVGLWLGQSDNRKRY